MPTPAPQRPVTPLPSTSAEARAAHEQRREGLEGQARAIARLSRTVSTLRLVTFVGAAATAFARGFGYLPSWAWGLAATLAIAFVGLVLWHLRIDRVERRLAAGIDYRKWSVKRIDGQFDEYPARGDRFSSEVHPYTSDLGVFGEASLFQLLDVTHTHRGETCLAGWLSSPSPLTTVTMRQQAVRELAGHAVMREALAVEGLLIAHDKPNPDPLLTWAEAPQAAALHRAAGVVAWLLPMTTLAAVVLGQLGMVSSNAWLAPAVVSWLYSLSQLPKVEPVAAAVGSSEPALVRYCAMLEILEGASVQATTLVALRRELAGDANARLASAEVRKLSSIVGFLDARRNEAFRLFIGPLLLWDVHGAVALERWRVRSGQRVRRWLDAIGELEALASLAGYAHDHPEHAWPQLTEEATFHAVKLGHPLIAESARVYNDVNMRGAGTALLVTGSNMSGKSTLLRAMGINLVLAGAGAPVVAQQMTASVFELRTSMWARDSLAKGVSHFYAELEKLKRVVDGLREDRPLFFLLDEILQGTNSRERVIGARSVLRHLLERGAMGAVSTHDVGLLELGPELDAKLDKVHFEEQVTETGPGATAMTFDYRLRPGVVRSTNALRLMKRVGIDVDLQ